jgi:hypothetical protein
VLGEDFAERIQNVGRAISDGRLRLIRGLYRKPA